MQIQKRRKTETSHTIPMFFLCMLWTKYEIYGIIYNVIERTKEKGRNMNKTIAQATIVPKLCDCAAIFGKSEV